MIRAPKLVQLYLDGRVKQPQLQQQLPRHRGRFGKPQHLGIEVRQIKIERTKRVDKLQDRGGFRVSEIDVMIQLFAEGVPVEIDEGMFLGDFLDDVVRDTGTVAKTSEMELPNFSAAAHIVHQVVRVSFAANKSHRSVLRTPLGSGLRPRLRCSVRPFHYTYQV